MDNFYLFTSEWDRVICQKEYVREGEGECCSFRGRGWALLYAVSFGVLTPLSPLVLLIVEIYQLGFSNELNHEHEAVQDYWKQKKCIALLDITALIITSPLLFLAKAVRYAIAAVIHPGIIYA